MARRFGEQIRHADNVDVERIRACFSPCGEYRYLLVIPYRVESRRNEVVSVILKNPSSADENLSDRSVRRAEEYVYRHFRRCSELRILNLFAYRATDPGYLQTRINQAGCINAVGPSNDRFLIPSFCSSTHIIVAWGRSGKISKICYDSRIAQVKHLLRPFGGKLWQVGTLCYPKHAQVWSYEDKLNRYQIQQSGS